MTAVLAPLVEQADHSRTDWEVVVEGLAVCLFAEETRIGAEGWKGGQGLRVVSVVVERRSQA